MKKKNEHQKQVKIKFLESSDVTKTDQNTTDFNNLWNIQAFSYEIRKEKGNQNDNLSNE